MKQEALQEHSSPDLDKNFGALINKWHPRGLGGPTAFVVIGHNAAKTLEIHQPPVFVPAERCASHLFPSHPTPLSYSTGIGLHGSLGDEAPVS